MKVLPYKQQVFANVYAATGNGTKAAIEAGYAERTAGVTASKLLKKANVQEAVLEAKKKRSLRTNKTADQVMNDLEETRQEAFNAGQYSAAARCSELQGKYLAMFTEKIQHSGEVAVNDLSDTERTHRVLEILNAARERGTGQATGSKHTEMDTTTSPASSTKH